MALPLAASAFLLFSGCGQTEGAGDPVTVVIETDEGTALNFDISGDGSFIVFDLLGELWRLPAEGGRATPITDAIHDTADYAFPSISPDGEWVSYSSVTDPLSPRLWERWIMSLTTGEIRRIDLPGHAGSSAWAPDGTRVVFRSGPEVWFYTLDTGETEPLDVGVEFQGPLSDPDWHPNGNRVAFRALPERWAPAGRIWEADLVNGTTVPITPEHLDASLPRYSPSGSRLGFLFQDSTGTPQVGIKDLGTDDWHVATDLEDVYSFRWSPSDDQLLVTAKGRLWQVPLEAGPESEIPFIARVEFERPTPPPALTFPEPGSVLKTRGYSGLAISPDGSMVGVIAFGHLWTISTGGPPRRVATVHPFSTGLSWSPSGREVVWSGGVEGTEDLFVTGVETGETRQLTALPGSEFRPSWSPDGSSVAFVHYEKPALDIPPWSRGPYAQLRVVAATGEAIARADETLHLGEARLWDGSGEEGPTWSPKSDALLMPVADTVAWPESAARTPRLVSLEGVSTPITGLPKPTTYMRWASDSSMVYVYDDRIYRAEISGPEVTRIELITEEAAVSPTVALDGSVLYRSSDGLRVRRPDGSLDILGWPIEMKIPAPPEPTVLANVRIFDAQTGALGAVTDILVEGGRIAEVGVSGSLGQNPEHRVVDGGGRIAIPGLIDLHIHGYNPSRVVNDLYFGITTVRDAGSREAPSAALRDAMDAQVIDGPRLVLGGPQFYPGEGPWTTEGGHGVTDLAGVERTLDLAAGLGVQQAKLYVPGPLKLATVFVGEARDRGMRITGHYASSLTLVAAGMDGKEHLGGPEGGYRLNRTWYDDMIQLFSKSGIGVTPTVEVRRTFWFHDMFDDPEIARAITPKVRTSALQQSPERVSQVDFTQPTPRHDELSPLIGTDVLIGAGNDGFVPSALHWELEGLVLAGMSPAQALISATSNAARILGAEASIGAIEEGKLADVVILDANPLEDIRNTRKIWMVIKGGRIIDREAILERNQGQGKTGG